METRLIPRFLRDLRAIRARERWSPERMQAFQADALRRTRAHALANSPFYRDLHRGLERAPLEALPIVTKSTLMSRFDDIACDRRVRLEDVRRHMRDEVATGARYLGRYGITTSGGSTGEVSIVLATPEEDAYGLAVASRGRAFGGMPWNPLRPRRVAEVVGMLPWLSSAQIARQERSRFAPLLHLAAGDPLEGNVAQLNAWQPEILEGYTSILGVLADEQIAGRLRISPGMVGSGGETISPEVRRRIRTAWGDDPYDYYGTAEGGTHAVECREGRRMHTMDDLMVQESVDDEYRPVRVGEPGTRLLVTTLWRTTMPLIRYEITDSVRMSPDPCPCGRPFHVLAEIRGRTSRLIRLPSVDGRSEVQISSMAFTHIANLPVVWRRITQEDDRVVLSVVGLADGYDTAQVARSLEATLVEHGARPTRVEIRVLSEIPRTAAGKAQVEPRVEATR